MTNNDIPMAEPSRENLRIVGRDALKNEFRAVALKCTLKFQLNNDDINEAACTIAKEVVSYQEETEDAA